MSNAPNPEHISWYDHLKPLEKTFGPNFNVMTDGFIDYPVTDIDSELLVEGGIKALTDVDRSNSYPAKLLITIKRRLNIDQVNSGRRPFIFVGDDQQLEIEFRGLPTDAEAMFFIALSMATREKPVETVLKEIREWGGAVLALDKEPAEANATVVSESLNKPGTFDEFSSRLKVHDVPSEKTALKSLYRSEQVRKMVRQFARYKELQEMLKTHRAENPTSTIKELIEIENNLVDELIVANIVANSNGYSLLLATKVTNIEQQGYHKDFPYVPCDSYLGKMKPADKEKLELVVLPMRYASNRRTTIAQEFHQASSDWF
jgi:hypothetical protein